LKSSLSGSLCQPPATDPPPLLPPELLSASMVFVRAIPAHPPLASTYTGPFKVASHLPAPDRRQNRHSVCPPSQAGLSAT
jgi:hypothetical protein